MLDPVLMLECVVLATEGSDTSHYLSEGKLKIRLRNKTGFKFKWREETRVGGLRRKRKLRFVQTLLLLLSSFIFHQKFMYLTTHKLVFGCRISSDIIQGVCVSESDTCTRILCVIRLHWEYVAPSSWYIDSQHNIITPSIHSQISFLSTHHRWILLILNINKNKFNIYELQVQGLLWI